ncbi:MAG TPA: hypothetical protein VIC34_08590 [Croceibacterium sp.]
MSRTLENVTLTYKRTTDDDDHLHITVGNCGSSPWEMDESLNGVTAAALRDAIAEEIDNAKLNCKLAEGIGDRLMAGFDEAFAKVKPFAPPHRATVGGWQLADEGSMPGDDSERSVTMTKALAIVTMIYQPYQTGEGASLNLKCKGADYGGGVDFGDPPEDHVKVVTKELADDYADFAKDCKAKPETQTELLQGFPEALATLEGWLKAKPFVYPPDNSSKQ